MNMCPWRKFRVGQPSERSNWTEPTCQPLVTVAHVAHVPTALRITEDGRLRADLVFDKSRLNTERIRVVWLSPNDWENAGGFRYGNIRFHFEWAKLVESKRIYWVESIAYGVEACRILLTDEDYTGTLPPYDPAAGDGPWWQAASGEHYWNGEYCLEVMVEGDLELASVTDVDFVKHHTKRCSVDYRTCRYCGTSSDDGGAELIAGMIARRDSVRLPGLVVDYGQGPRPSRSFDGAVSRLMRRIEEARTRATGPIGRNHPSARALARAALATLAIAEIADDLGELASQFASIDELMGAVADAIAAAVGLPDTSALRL